VKQLTELKRLPMQWRQETGTSIGQYFQVLRMKLKRMLEDLEEVGFDIELEVSDIPHYLGKSVMSQTREKYIDISNPIDDVLSEIINWIRYD